jgi:hypothetical protein
MELGRSNELKVSESGEGDHVNPNIVKTNRPEYEPSQAIKSKSQHASFFLPSAPSTDSGPMLLRFTPYDVFSALTNSGWPDWEGREILSF